MEMYTMIFNSLKDAVQRWRSVDDEKTVNFPLIPSAAEMPVIFREKMQYAEQDKFSNTPAIEVPMVILDNVN
jgi:hypothetical protein